MTRINDTAPAWDERTQLTTFLDYTRDTARAKRAVRDGLHVDLRWILLHLTEETARHNGHLDILREMLDGTTGH
ncbi:DUF664 domain-containing protein [Streptomyces subrutilus]|uniref:Mini-circle protein n=1 Tax=Streptomyces subrutilus TaxID=36818 RepID=A0A1E5PM21_9ACTN|nr:DUF664 domain-containing protein [Streptomyces subrutilus]OEJ30412.1 hypothetical protein BGK67_02730 [Streptomyces subrutilus]